MTLNEKGLEAAYIRLSQGRFVLVDAADYDFLMQRKWHLLNNYAYSSTKRPTISMHRLLTNAPKGSVVDHINANKLDNRRCNLQVVTMAENTRKSLGFRTKQKMRCVYKIRKSYAARLNIKSIKYHLGVFESPELAAKIADIYALKYFGKHAAPNFQLSPDEQSELWEFHSTVHLDKYAFIESALKDKHLVTEYI